MKLDPHSPRWLLVPVSIAFLVTMLIYIRQPQYKPRSFIRAGFVVPYDVYHPDEKFKLPDELNEISGISFLPPAHLACIQDENETIYCFDLVGKKIADIYPVGTGNNYEDIAIVDGSAYLLHNNGNIIRVDGFRTQAAQKIKYCTPLSRKNNAEGLAYDPGEFSLLIACKGSQLLKKKKHSPLNKLVVYKFDIKTGTLDLNSSILIDLGLLTNQQPFLPSAISLHPRTGHLYILSAAGSRLLIADRHGEILADLILPDKIFRQPEGICFDPDGNLFIANERRSKRANILKFKYTASALAS